MKIVVFGQALSSSQGNGRGTSWRGLSRALAARNHLVVFFERDADRASHRGRHEWPGGRLHLYADCEQMRLLADRELSDATAGIVTSGCPDAVAAEALLLDSGAALRVFYDLDTPVTLERASRGDVVPYIGPSGLRNYDLVLSGSGGASLDHLQAWFGARDVLPLYGSVDPLAHQPADPADEFKADLSYIATCRGDQQDGVERLFLEPARRLPHRRFVLAGSEFPARSSWSANVIHKQQVPPERHPAVYCSSRLTLNVTRRTMAHVGYCPSRGLFEAAACGAAILSDGWVGLERFFEPGREILVASSTDDAVAALERSDAELRRMAARGRRRALAEHTSEHRAIELECILQARKPEPVLRRVRIGAAGRG